jgi:hypothetical protein
MKLQSAIEYLISYSWAIIIIVIVLTALIGLGIFNSQSFIGQQCIVSTGFSCVHFAMNSTGALFISLMQSTTTPINITGVACYQNSSAVYVSPLNPPSNQIYMNVGAEHNFTTQCYTSSGIAFNGVVGSQFQGKIGINYTSLSSVATADIPNTATGIIIARVSTPGVLP